MEYIKIDLSKLLSREDQVKVGEEYYFFDIIALVTEGYEVEATRGTLTGFTDDDEYIFEVDDETAFTYAYPIENK